MSKATSATNTESVQRAISDLARFIRKLDTVPVEELQKSANTIYANAVAEAPYSTGKLERSIYVRVSKNAKKPGLRAGASARAPSGYDYAGIQHENTDFNHPTKGKDHYISDPFNAEVAQLKTRLRGRLKVRDK